MKLYNTLSRKIESFTGGKGNSVTLYTCGPTVYDFSHIGHARKYINDDLLKRTLTFLGYKVNHVMNITDVGHLTSDQDAGEDKLEQGAVKSGKTVWEVAEFYTDYFLKMTREVNILKPDQLVKATEHIPEMLQLIKKLAEKNYVYDTGEAVYFDTSRFKGYGKLSGQKLDEKLKGSREDVYKDPKKKNPTDFALWFKRIGRFKNHSMYWDSPWGQGFPGWHLECSALSMKYLGETVDIHTGGVDHIPVHHENEIAQSEAATGKQFVRFWVHYDFLLVEGEKMSKSLHNFFTLDDLKKKNIEPLALRYLYLQTHYRKQLNFTWQSVQAAQETYNRLKTIIISLNTASDSRRTVLSEDKLRELDDYRTGFIEAIADDLQFPQAIAVMWKMLKSNIPSVDKKDLLSEFDQVLGLNLNQIKETEIPREILKTAEIRENARQKKDYATSDRLRKEVLKKGYLIEDFPVGFKIKKTH